MDIVEWAPDAVIAPVVTAGLAAAGLWIGERRKERDLVQCRLRALSEETAHLTYLKAWLEAQHLAGGTAALADAQDDVRRELGRARHRLGAVLEEHQPHAKASTSELLGRAWRLAALMPLHRPLARAVRWVYWFFALTALSTLSSVLTVVDELGTSSPLLEAASIIVTLAVMWVPVLLGLRAAALALERRGAPDRQGGPIDLDAPPPAAQVTRAEVTTSPAPHGGARAGGPEVAGSRPVGVGP
jgi:hypothetical protein